MLTANRIMGGIGKAGFFMGLGVAGGIGVAVKQAGDFQEQMNVLKSVTGANADQMHRMRKEAIALGDDLKLPNTSAQDAADTLTELSKGGLSVKDAMSAARGTIQLSTAAQIDNADAAKIQARALNAFGLSGKDAGKVADLLAGAANKSTAEISDLALGLQQASAVWHSGGQNIDALTTSLGLMANAGISGSDAGTSLKTMMSRLNPQTEKAKAEFKKLGVEVFDAHGNYRSMRDIIGQFHGALDKLTPKQKQHALYTIFGSDAIRAANVVLDGGVKKYDAMHKAVTKSGSAQKLAAAHTKGFNGSIQALISQLQTAAINIGTLFLPIMTQWVRRAGQLAGWMSKHPALMKTILVVVGALSVAMVTLTGVYKIYMGVTKLAEFYTKTLKIQQIGARIATVASTAAAYAYTGALWAINTAMEANPIFLIIGALVLLGVALVIAYKKWGWFHKVIDAAWDKIKQFASWVGDVFTKTIPHAFHVVIGWLKDHWQDAVVLIVAGPFGLLLKKANDAFGLVGKIKSAFNTVLGKIKDWGRDVFDFFSGLPGKIWDYAKKMGGKLKDGFVEGVKGFVGALKDVITGGLNAVIGLWNRLAIPGWHKTLGGWLGSPKITVGWSDIGLPDIPYLAQGGIVTKPTVALLGDNPGGHEAVVPLPSAGLGGGDTHVHLTVEGSVITQRDLETTIISVLEKYGKRNGRVRLSQATTS